MDLATVTAIRPELEAALAGRRFGKIFQLSRTDIAIDFRLENSRYLFISVEPADPRAYLIKRRLRDLERASVNPGPFTLHLRKILSGATLTNIEQFKGERVLVLLFDTLDDLGEQKQYKLAMQLTGRSANLFLLDSHSTILESARQTRGAGQHPGDSYHPPSRAGGDAIATPHARTEFSTETLSEALDAEALERSADKEFGSIATAARNKLKQEIARRRKLVRKLHDDLAGHGDAERWKRYGDLLLANAATAHRDGDRIFVTDYFDDAAPEISIEVDQNDSVTNAAEKFFKRYTKARNAGKEIENRLKTIEEELAGLEADSVRIETAIEARDEPTLRTFTRKSTASARRSSGARAGNHTGTRAFVSSDGFEILVGKKAKDNDFLTFRIAKSLDTWMHAADYPGSHVVIRNPNRKEIPHRTLIEAAQLAAFYSQGNKQPKAAVHYTQKKFVNKPKGSAPGLVSLASFKTLLVEPKIGASRRVVNGER